MIECELATFQRISNFFQLGHALHVVPLAGARSHAVYHLTTDQGDYCVKHFLSHCHVFVNSEVLRATADIAQFVYDHDMPVISAVRAPHGDEVLYCDKEQFFMVYPYLSAHSLTADMLTVTQCEYIARGLGQLHQLNLTSHIPLPVWKFHYDASIWAAAHTYLSAQQCVSATVLLTRLNEKIAVCFSNALAAQEMIVADPVVSHRDIDPLNILWLSHTEYRMIDWDLAGEIDAAVELLYVALGFALESASYLNFEKFQAVLVRYSRERRVLTQDVKPLLYTVLAYWLSWVQQQLQRMLCQDFDAITQHHVIASVTYSLCAMEHVLEQEEEIGNTWELLHLN